MPRLKGIEIYKPTRTKLEFWTMCSAMMLMGLTFGIAGVLQSYGELSISNHNHARPLTQPLKIRQEKAPDYRGS